MACTWTKHTKPTWFHGERFNERRRVETGKETGHGHVGVRGDGERRDRGQEKNKENKREG